MFNSKIKQSLFFLFFFVTVLSSAQNVNKLIDSLKLNLNKDLSQEQRIKTLGDLAWYYKETSIDSSLKYGEIAIKLSKNSTNKKLKAQTYSDVAGVFLLKGDTNKSRSYYKKSLKLREELNDSLGIAKVKANLLAFYTKYNVLDTAMVYGIDAMKYFEKKGIENYSNTLKSNIATLYQTMRNYDKALKYNFEVLEFSKRNNNDNLTAKLYNNIASVYYFKKDTLKSIENYKKAIKYAKKTKNNHSLGSSLNNLSGIYFDLNDVEKGIETANEALKYRKFLNSEIDFASLNYSLGTEYFKLSKFKKSKYHLEEALPTYISVNNKQKLFSIYSYLSLLNAKAGNVDEMVSQKVKANLLLEDYSDSQSNKQIAELETKYQTEKKEKELLKTKAEKATAELKLGNQKLLTYGLLGGLALLLLGGYSLVQRNKRKHQEAITKEKEAGLQAIIQAEENERSKIARELHDGVVQQIGSVILNSRNILDKMNLLDTPESKELLKSLEDSNQDIRNISHQMMPRALEELGLVSALEDLLNASLPLKGIKVNFEHFNITERLPKKIEKTLYRIVQELTNNILKHSKASEVSVQLFKAQNNIMLIVEDNGVGMSDKKSKGIGLMNINSRLDMVNGSVNFEPSPESGTLVTIKIPFS